MYDKWVFPIDMHINQLEYYDYFTDYYSAVITNLGGKLLCLGPPVVASIIPLLGKFSSWNLKKYGWKC